MHKQQPHFGFLIIELTVVIAIIGLLLAMTLVGVQKVRSSAARASCLNNLRQIGLALHQYDDVHRALPPGVYHPKTVPGAFPLYPIDADPFPLLNWQGRILPFLGEESLWQEIEAAYEIDPYYLANPPHIAQRGPIRVFICPADGRREAIKAFGGQSDAPTDYLGVSGTNSHRHDGLLYLDSRVRLSDITDGTSTTVMVAERPPSTDFSHGRWYGGWGSWGTADAYLGVRERDVPLDDPSGCEPGPYHFGPDTLKNPCSIYHSWSLHPGGAHFLTADGAARFLGYGGDEHLPALATRSGREVVSWSD